MRGMICLMTIVISSFFCDLQHHHRVQPCNATSMVVAAVESAPADVQTFDDEARADVDSMRVASQALEERVKKCTELATKLNAQIEETLRGRKLPKNDGSGVGGGRPSNKEQEKLREWWHQITRLKKWLLPGEPDRTEELAPTDAQLVASAAQHPADHGTADNGASSGLREALHVMDCMNMKCTGLTQNLGQLEGSFRDFRVYAGGGSVTVCVPDRVRA